MKRNIIIPYEAHLKERARELRKNATVAERLLWQEIRSKRLGVEFHRQVPIDRFIVDFYCHELMLAIEIDGITHNSDTAYQKDLERQTKIETFGVLFLRFFDHDVRENLQGVVMRIRNWIEGRNIPPTPFKGGKLSQLFKNEGRLPHTKQHRTLFFILKFVIFGKFTIAHHPMHGGVHGTHHDRFFTGRTQEARR